MSLFKRLLRRMAAVPHAPPHHPSPIAPRHREPVTPRGTVEISLPSTVDTGKFARYVPFGDGREVIVRRGAETGFHYGFEQERRRVRLEGGDFDLVTFENVLSPPVLIPGQGQAGAGDYHPVKDVLYLPGTEVMIPRRPLRRGFTDDEVARILEAIRVS